MHREPSKARPHLLAVTTPVGSSTTCQEQKQISAQVHGRCGVDSPAKSAKAETSSRSDRSPGGVRLQQHILPLIQHHVLKVLANNDHHITILGIVPCTRKHILREFTSFIHQLIDQT